MLLSFKSFSDINSQINNEKISKAKPQHTNFGAFSDFNKAKAMPEQGEFGLI